MHQRKDGRFVLNVYVGTVNGKQIYKTVTGATEKEVNRKAAALKAQRNDGVNLASPESFRWYSERWLRSKRLDVQDGQFKNYQTILKHLEPIADLQAADIRPSDIREIIDTLAAMNPNTGKPTSKKTLRDVRNVAYQVLNLPLEDRVIQFNPASPDFVKIPKTAPVTKRTMINDEQIGWILDTPHRCQTAAMLMLFAGLRRGEVGALTRSDVDLQARTISVNKRVVFDGKTAQVVSGAKTEAGVRTVPIPDVLADYLSSHPTTNWFIAFDTDQPLNQYEWTSAWRSYMSELDFRYGLRAMKLKSKYQPRHGTAIKTFTPHQLRHTYASLLYDAGVDALTAQKIMGHSDITTTLGIYTDLRNRKEEHSVELFNDFLKSTDFKTGT